MPMASTSLAWGLSSDVKSSVSSESMSFKRKRSSVTRKGLANLRAFLIRFFISLLFTDSPLVFLPLTATHQPLALRGEGDRVFCVSARSPRRGMVAHGRDHQTATFPAALRC